MNEIIERMEKIERSIHSMMMDAVTDQLAIKEEKGDYYDCPSFREAEEMEQDMSDILYHIREALEGMKKYGD